MGRIVLGLIGPCEIIGEHLPYKVSDREVDHLPGSFGEEASIARGPNAKIVRALCTVTEA